MMEMAVFLLHCCNRSSQHCSGRAGPALRLCYLATTTPIMAVLLSALRDGGSQVKDLIRETPEMAPALCLPPFSLRFLDNQPKEY